MKTHTLGGKKYDTSSRLNKVPPIGAPKATATPAAHAALRISRRFAARSRFECHRVGFQVNQVRTFVVFIFSSNSTDDIPHTAGNVNKWSFLPEGETRGHRQSQAD